MITLMEDPATVIRRTQGVFKKGVFTDSLTSKKFDIDCSIQPSKGEDLEKVTELQRTSLIVRVYTEDKLQLTDELAKTKSDLLMIDDDLFQVEHVERWRGPLPHFMALACKLTPEQRAKTGL